MPEPNDYPDDLSDSILDVDPADVVANQLHEDDAPADAAPAQGQRRPHKTTDARKRKIVWATLGIAALVIAGLAWHLMDTKTPAQTPAPPALAKIQQLARHPIQAPAETPAPAPADTAPKITPPMTVTAHAPASASTASSAPAAATSSPHPVSLPPVPRVPVKPVPAPTFTHRTRVIPAVPAPHLEPPPPASSSNKLKAQIKALRGQLKQAQAKLKTEHGKYLHQLHIGQSEYQRLKHAVPGKTRVTAVLRDGVVLTLPSGKRRVVSQGDALQ